MQATHFQRLVMPLLLVIHLPSGVNWYCRQLLQNRLPVAFSKACVIFLLIVSVIGSPRVIAIITLAPEGFKTTEPNLRTP